MMAAYRHHSQQVGPRNDIIDSQEVKRSTLSFSQDTGLEAKMFGFRRIFCFF